MPPIAHPGRLLRRELKARGISANRLALDLGVPSGRVTDILNGRRSITADTAVRLGRFFGNRPQFCDSRQRSEITRLRVSRRRQILRDRPQLPEGAFRDHFMDVHRRRGVGDDT
ncbi:HigA family addiction module antidote protein, partial [candidate division KSB1 bacterium]|nr:HigA family addiction module antidote protein [candidate division KSB1 bacterium]